MENEFSFPPGKPSDGGAVAFAIICPTVITLVYFQWLKDSGASYQQIAYGVGKCVQFLFPVIWVGLWYRSKFFQRTVSHDNLKQVWLGVAFGLLVVATMFGIYYLFLEGSEVGVTLVDLVREKIAGLSVNSLEKYLGLAVFYALCHSFLEEYYFRWFVFDYLKKFFSCWTSIILSSFAFMAHHVVVLGFYFGWASPLTYFFSLCIAVGGVFWAWQYEVTGKLRTSWISHMIVDAGIFALGYFLIRDMLL
ncbi:MAG: CPBP family intramembrane metalloprotease [Mariniblastus sp.]|nr:CPBP family intramembrane metalloprotease [Mariniblastus sp.]